MSASHGSALGKKTVAAAAATKLDRSSFDAAVELVALKISKRHCTSFLQRLAGHIYHKSRVKPIVAAEGDAESRLLLLAESVGLELAELPAEMRDFVLAEGAQPVRHTLKLGYEHLDAAQALKRVLPSDIGDIPSSFEQVGHVAHVNLREEHLPYKNLIGQVLLDKNTPRIRSVVNKVESISNTADEKAWRFRVFPMEVLAGDESLRTSVRENGARFELDYRDVYWNSRLETEHKRILDLLPPNAVVADAFAGIGPFAVPAALRGCAVYANDLNPHSYEWLCVNVEKNKVARTVRTYNLDGRAFVHALLGHDARSAKRGGGGGGGGGAGSSNSDAVPAPQAAPEGSALAKDLAAIAGAAAAEAASATAIGGGSAGDVNAAAAAAAAASDSCDAAASASVISSSGSKSGARSNLLPLGFFSHVLMNLPASALTFLDAFVGSFDRKTWKAPLPTVHCYCFSKADDPKAEVIGIAEKAMGCALPDATVTVVRDVSPHKLMLCLAFQVPDAVAWREEEGEEEERSKRPRNE